MESKFSLKQERLKHDKNDIIQGSSCWKAQMVFSQESESKRSVLKSIPLGITDYNLSNLLNYGYCQAYNEATTAPLMVWHLVL